MALPQLRIACPPQLRQPIGEARIKGGGGGLQLLLLRHWSDVLRDEPVRHIIRKADDILLFVGLLVLHQR